MTIAIKQIFLNNKFIGEMRAVIQRVTRAKVTINGDKVEQIGKGLLVLLGIEEADSEEDCTWLANKVCKIRIFDDSEGIMNLDVNSAEGEVMIISQFTLFALTKKGNRPSYIRAAKHDKAIPLYDEFINQMRSLVNKNVRTGVFASDMQVELLNNGPVTILIDTKNKE